MAWLYLSAWSKKDILIEINHFLQSTMTRMCTTKTSRNPIELSVVIWFQVAGKRDLDQEVEAQQWIEAVTGEKFAPGKYYIIYYYYIVTIYWYLDKHIPNPVVLGLGLPFELALRDGVLLCKLMNKLAPGIIPKINTSGGDYKMMDNISQYV